MIAYVEIIPHMKDHGKNSTLHPYHMVIQTKLSSLYTTESVVYNMNIESEHGTLLIARTAGNKNSGQRIIYSFTSPEHALGVGKKDIILAEIEACGRLLKYVSDESEKSAVEKEISGLRMALDLLT